MKVKRFELEIPIRLLNKPLTWYTLREVPTFAIFSTDFYAFPSNIRESAFCVKLYLVFWSRLKDTESC